MIDYAQILVTHYQGKSWSVAGYSYDDFIWYEDTPKPTKEELDALWNQTEIVVQLKEAKIQRAHAYISESDPLFFKAQRGEATMDEWQAKVAEIKTRYPKA